MWKESYKLGDALIDSQHRELFLRTDKLLRIVEGDDAHSKKQECIDAILFLKGYAVNHFAAEEDYMIARGYKGYEAHKVLHDAFIDSVLESEKEMTKADFSLPSVKHFTGFLTTWLIYHVAGADQRIVKGEEFTRTTIPAKSYVDGFVKSIAPVLETVVALTEKSVIFDQNSHNEDVICIHVAVSGTKMGDVIFTIPKETAVNIVSAMTSVKFPELNETAISALTEIINIISRNAASLIVAGGDVCGTQKPRIQTDTADVYHKSDFRISTEYGPIAVAVNVD